MPSKILATDAANLEAAILQSIRQSGSSALGLAVAYVSIYGAHFLRDTAERAGVDDIRLIADIGDAITHPQALRLALAEGWGTRVVNPATGTFHPKVVIGGQQFDDETGMQETSLLVVGSANLTKGGLRSNVECVLIRTNEAAMPVAANLFKRLWSLGDDLTDEAVDAYEIEFAARNRARPPKDLQVLGVADEAEVEVADSRELRQRRTPQPRERSIATAAAAAAWAGLESFTGEYRFQVEFPRDAGEVLRRMLEPVGGQIIQVRCEDGSIREMRYRYYADNAMFRMNVPNDTPGVAWAREHRSGIAVVEALPEGDVPLRFRIIRPGRQATDVIGRSVALGTWGKTPTRFYGWF